MEDALYQILWALKDLAVPALAVAITGLLKYAMPKLKDAVPSVAWPFVALGFARMGTKFCYAIDAPCEGNFVNWSDPEAYVIAQGLLVVVIREIAKDVTQATPRLLEKLGAPPPPPPPPTFADLDAALRDQGTARRRSHRPLVGVLFLVFLGLTAGACGPLRVPNPPVFTVGGYAFQRADCESLPAYLEHNAQALALFEQLGGTILTTFVQASDDGALKLTGRAGFDYLGVAMDLLQAQIGAGVRLNEIPNVFLLRPFTCHELVPVPPAAATLLDTPGAPLH